jgi:hypothetical protein
MTAAEREAMIAQWWEDVNGWEWLLVEATIGARLSRAFHQVLMAMPVDVCRKFLELTPLVLCQQGARAAVLGLMVHPVGNVEEAGRWQPVMYFAPTIARMADHHLVDCGDPIACGPKSSNFYKPLIHGDFPGPCRFSCQETLGRASYRDVDCLTGFSAQE